MVLGEEIGDVGERLQAHEIGAASPRSIEVLVTPDCSLVFTSSVKFAAHLAA